MALSAAAHPPDLGGVAAVYAELAAWLCDAALPLWDHHGVDRQLGGFFETLEAQPAIPDLLGGGDVRRGRVVARQIYVFEVGHALGWQSSYTDVARHGADYLFAKLHRGDGQFHTAVDAASGAARAPFSLYEAAFYLLALARLVDRHASDFALEHTALRCLDQLQRHWARPNGGFNETSPPTQPLRSNPHMHLLEAALAWIAAVPPERRAPWIGFARDLVDLCLTRFLDPSTGAVRELFDVEWRPLDTADARLIEPGHLFEWGWLLLQWVDSGHCEAARKPLCETVARRLIATAEAHGVDPVRGVVINGLDLQLAPQDRNAKPWPQCERIKAWSTLLLHAGTPQERQAACRNIVAAVRGLTHFFSARPEGLWHEVSLPEGGFSPGPTKASSFYHVACAIDILRQTMTAQQGAAP